MEELDVYIEVNINYWEYDENDEDTDEVLEINLGKKFKYDRRIPIEDVKEIIINSLKSFFQIIDLFGRYDIYIDDEECLDSKYLHRECFDDFNSETKLIKINLDSQYRFDENDEKDYQKYLKEALKDSLDEYKINKRIK